MNEPAMTIPEQAVEKRAPVQGYSAGIPWSMHLRAYDAYCKKWSPQPAMIDLEGRNCRGGFSVGELDDFIPGWRDELSRIGQLETEIGCLRLNLAESAKEIARLTSLVGVERADLETAADAIDAARYAHPDHPRERPRPFAEADSGDREYAFRLARAAFAALPPLRAREEIAREVAKIVDEPLGDGALAACDYMGDEAADDLRKAVTRALSGERASIIEQCAKVAEAYDMDGAFKDDMLPRGWRGCRRQIAAAIRALLPAPPVAGPIVAEK